MNKKGFGLITFLIGVGAGFAAGAFIATEKYRKQTEEKMDEIKSFYENKYKQAKETVTKIKTVVQPKKKEPLVEAKAKAEAARRVKPDLASYMDYSKQYQTPMNERPHILHNEPPVVIPPDEVGEDLDYDVVSLTYYSCGTLVDGDDLAYTQEEVERSVGLQSLATFGQYEHDSVFVRNDQQKKYFEILLDERTYAEVVEEKPYLVED